jgi:hypothetical protein
MNQVGVSRRFCRGPLCHRADKGDATAIDIDNRTIPFILVSEDNAGERYDWWEGETYIEELDPSGARFDELHTFFKDHTYSVDTAVGSVNNVRLEEGKIKADVKFGTDEDSERVFVKYKDRVLTDVSVGYYVNDVVITEKKGEPDHVLVTDYSIVELSAVWRGFDRGATIGRASAHRSDDEKEAAEKLHDTDILRRKMNLKLKQKKGNI